ncbi:hypothetical protein ACIBHY_50105 [Nonomuraea sp. NPDC050547]|uniref:hypothetical protein n=1 Tax=Nonomuraea sp. NPDC050547 TaxID=3364368 RepID=UPI0037B17AF3
MPASPCCAAGSRRSSPTGSPTTSYSCHGLKDQRGRLNLAAAGTELGSLAATGLPASFVAWHADRGEAHP